MHTRILAALLIGCALTGSAIAETVVVDGMLSVMPTQTQTPKRGTTMSEVEKRFGAPADRHPTVGKPPITRWDYQGFSVFFEGERVIDSVVTAS